MGGGFDEHKCCLDCCGGARVMWVMGCAFLCYLNAEQFCASSNFLSSASWYVIFCFFPLGGGGGGATKHQKSRCLSSLFKTYMKSHTEIHNPEIAIQSISSAFWVERGHQNNNNKKKASALFFQINFYKRIAESNVTSWTFALHWPFDFLMVRTEHLDENAELKMHECYRNKAIIYKKDIGFWGKSTILSLFWWIIYIRLFDLTEWECNVNDTDFSHSLFNIDIFTFQLFFVCKLSFLWGNNTRVNS